MVELVSRFFYWLSLFLVQSLQWIKGLVQSIFSAIPDIIDDFFSGFIYYALQLFQLIGVKVGFFAALLKDFLTLLKDLFFWVMKTGLDLILWVLDFFASFFDSLPSFSQYIGALPPELINMLGLIRIPEAIGIVIGALIIRTVLRFIPIIGR